ncbi:MAG TPA: hypothetical protein DDY91_21215 [Planctomycetaceae bacterium]|nr:hypothetical protein [Planctomycetaceae bacterium]
MEINPGSKSAAPFSASHPAHRNNALPTGNKHRSPAEVTTLVAEIRDWPAENSPKWGGRS